MWQLKFAKTTLISVICYGLFVLYLYFFMNTKTSVATLVRVVSPKSVLFVTNFIDCLRHIAAIYANNRWYFHLMVDRKIQLKAPCRFEWAAFSFGLLFKSATESENSTTTQTINIAERVYSKENLNASKHWLRFSWFFLDSCSCGMSSLKLFEWKYFTVLKWIHSR